MSTVKFDELVRKFNELRQLCYQNFAVRITNIEDYLSTLTERVIEGSVIVTGAFESEKISSVNISESQLVQVYNDVPQVLFKNALVVELTAKSYRDINNDQPVLLENDQNGKFWLITTDVDQFFIVPSMNIKSNIYKLKTVEKLFDFYGEYPSVDSHCLLVKPAKVSSQASGKEWQLQERGILEFKNLFLQVPLELGGNMKDFPDFKMLAEDSPVEIQKMAKQLDDLKVQFNESQEEIKKLLLKVEELSNKLRWLD